MSHHIAVHGNSAVSDGSLTIQASGPSGAHITAPVGSKFPHQGKVYFVFQNPPMHPDKTFDITGLNVNVNTVMASFDQVDVYSGFNNIISLQSSQINPLTGDTVITNLSAINLKETTAMMSPRAGLCVIYTITFTKPTSSANFGSLDIAYAP